MSEEKIFQDNIYNRAHYTVYPVQPIEITRYLGFCLGNATKYVLRAPYKGGVEDCDKALRYLEMERETPQMPLFHQPYCEFQRNINQLAEWLFSAPGDALWKDVSSFQGLFLDTLRDYLFFLEWKRIRPCNDKDLNDMIHYVGELHRVLALRDTTGQIYEGMTGLPVRGNVNE